MVTLKNTIQINVVAINNLILFEKFAKLLFGGVIPFIRSISGIRATIGEDFPPYKIIDYAAGFAEFLPEGAIVIGRDGRPSGLWIEKIIAGTLAACGRDVRMIGIVPTPTVQYIVEHSDAVGGIAVTASHNPAQWNGMKFIGSSGVFLDFEENSELFELVDTKNFKFSSSPVNVNILDERGAIGKHIASILNLPIFTKSGNLDLIRNKNYKVVVDAVNSSGSVAIPLLLEMLGCQTVNLYCSNSGIFPHTPEPISENLFDLADAVKSSGANFGIAVDPDADRLVLIDETGNPIGEEKTITLAVRSVLSNKENISTENSLSVAVNYSTTRLVEDIAKQYGAEVFRSPVGEINVVKKMKEVSAIIGGEGSGGVILPASHYGRDSLVGTALVLLLLAQTGKSLSELCKEMPHYEMLKTKQEFSGTIEPLIEKLIAEFSNCKVIRDDGIKIELAEGWVQLRSSNTEPIIRIIAEAPSRMGAEILVNRVLKIIN